MISDAELAWLLADATRPYLNRHECQMAYIDLGSGDELLAIERILHAVIAAGYELPPSLITLVEGWIERYRGSGFEPTLDALVGRLVSTRRELVSGSVAIQIDGPHRLAVQRHARTDSHQFQPAHSA
jgi:hypothetical protein